MGMTSHERLRRDLALLRVAHMQLLQQYLDLMEWAITMGYRPPHRNQIHMEGQELPSD